MTEAEGSQRAVRVAIVDDDPFVVQALRSYLSSSPQIEVLSTFTSARDLLAFLKRIPVDVLVSDVRMPGMDGLELLARVQEQHPRTAVVMLTSFDDDSAMLTALSQQANGFLLKDSSSPTTTSRLVSQHLRPRRVGGHPDLTEAEQAVLDLLCEGYSNAEIAGRLVVAESTVKTHVSNLMKKYGTPSRLKLVVAVHQLG